MVRPFLVPMVVVCVALAFSLSAAPLSSAPPISPAQVDQMMRATAALYTPRIVKVPEEGLAVPLPDKPSAVTLANFGWQAIVVFPSLTKLGVFNVATGSFDGFIDCADPAPILAAGGNLLVVYLPTKQTFELYNLTNLQKIASAKNTLPGLIAYLGMGQWNPTQLFALSRAQGGFRSDRLAPAVLTLPDFKATALSVGQNDGADALSAMRIDSSMAVLGAMDDYGTHCAFGPRHGRGLGIFDLRGGPSASFHHYDVGTGEFDYSQGGVFLVATYRIVNANDEKELNSPPFIWDNGAESFYASIAGYPGYVERFTQPDYPRPFKNGFRIVSLPNKSVLWELPISGEQAKHLPINMPTVKYAFMLASAAPDRIVYVVAAEKMVRLFPLGLRGGVAKVNVATPGKRFEKKLDVAVGSTVEMQDAPPGLVYDPKSTSVFWNIPASAKSGQVIQVIMLVTPPGGKGAYLIEKISIP